MAPEQTPKVTLKSLQEQQDKTTKTLTQLTNTLNTISQHIGPTIEGQRVKKAPKNETADPEATTIVDAVVAKTVELIENKVAPQPPVAEVPATPATTPASTKASASEMVVPTEKLVRAFGAIILGGGLVAVLWYAFGGTGLLNLLLFTALPLLAMFAAFKLISYGSLQMIWNGSLEEKVNEYVVKLREDAAKKAAIPA